MRRHRNQPRRLCAGAMYLTARGTSSSSPGTPVPAKLHIFEQEAWMVANSGP
jgi:hypothetical protein